MIHNFDTSSHPNPLLEGATGNLYGTTINGGEYGAGLMFQLASGTWKETVFHQFCSDRGCSDGGSPFGRLLFDGAGNIYATAASGGANGYGVVFEYTTGAAYKVLYNFCSGQNCADGMTPEAGLVLDSNGNLFGTTFGYGSGSPAGNVFELTDSAGVWTEYVLHTFCSWSGCADGLWPGAPLSVNASGNLFGTTIGDDSQNILGNVFELTPQ